MFARFPLSPEYPRSHCCADRRCADRALRLSGRHGDGPRNPPAALRQSWNNTVPVAVLGAMLAVKVTVCPDTLGLMLDTKLVVVAT